MRKAGLWGALALLAPAIAMMAAADGSWLKKVSDADRARINPYAGQAAAVAAGGNVYGNNCAKCHGDSGEGKHGRPSLKSDRIAHATDGELAWILKNGVPFRGMPSWSGLPEPQRWQLVTYIRSLQAPSGGGR